MRTTASLASGLGLTRNESRLRFPHAEEPAALEELREEVVEALTGGLWENEWEVYYPEDMSPVELEYMVEQGLMTSSFADHSGSARGFAVYGRGAASLEINGEDHFRLLGFRQDEELTGLWALLNRLDDRLEMVFTYAFDPRFGYLTARPLRSGTGMRAYLTLHLPALLLTGRLPQVALELAGKGISLTPLWAGAGGIMQVFNSSSQGRPEEEMIQQIQHIAENVTETERSVRKMLLREDPVQIRDQIGRAIGIAQHARSMSFAEAVNLISAVQVGIELGLAEAPGLMVESPFAFMTRLQSAHIVMEHLEGKTGCLESPEVDECRARLMREAFAGARVLD